MLLWSACVLHSEFPKLSMGQTEANHSKQNVKRHAPWAALAYSHLHTLWKKNLGLHLHTHSATSHSGNIHAMKYPASWKPEISMLSSAPLFMQRLCSCSVCVHALTGRTTCITCCTCIILCWRPGRQQACEAQQHQTEWQQRGSVCWWAWVFC